MTEENTNVSPIRAVLKFVPVVILAVLMIYGFDALLAAPIATVVAVTFAIILDRYKFKDCLDAAVSSVSNIIVALFIMMIAYAMASVFMSTGVGAAVVNLALSAGINGRMVAVIGLLVTAVLSVATGTSWGTFAACAPIFLWLNHIVDGNIYLTACAIAGGACFGDNIGLISDTTIVSSGIQGVEVIHRIRHQGAWSAICLVLAAVCFFIAGTIMGLPTSAVDGSSVIAEIPDDVWEYLAENRADAADLLNQVAEGVPLYMVIPLLLVVGLAVAGLNTFACIGTGIVSAYIFGLFAGTVPSLVEYLEQCMDGFADAGSWVVVMMMWVAAFGGIMQKMNAFEPLSRLIVRVSRKVSHLMTCNALLCILGNMALADEMAQIVTIGPIIKETLEENVEGSEEDIYKLRLRNATFGDAMGVFGSQLIPWHVYLAYYVGITAAIYPLAELAPTDFIKYNFMAIIAVVSLLILTFTGADRFIPMFRVPKEPDVRLRRQ